MKEAKVFLISMIDCDQVNRRVYVTAVRLDNDGTFSFSTGPRSQAREFSRDEAFLLQKIVQMSLLEDMGIKEITAIAA